MTQSPGGGGTSVRSLPHRAPFPSSASGDKALDGYSKKKYVCKLLFIFLLGHDIDFGHMEAVNLLSSNKYTEKQIVSAGGTRVGGCWGGGRGPGWVGAGVWIPRFEGRKPGAYTATC